MGLRGRDTNCIISRSGYAGPGPVFRASPFPACPITCRSGAIVDRRCSPSRAGRLCPLSRLARRALSRQPRRLLGLLPHPQPRSSRPDPRRRGRAFAGGGGGASALHCVRERARPHDGPSVPGAARSRWTTRASSTRCALSRSIRFAPGWRRLLKRGRGRACARIFKGHDDALVEVGPALERAPRFADLLELSLDEQAALDGFETLSLNGRPLGGQDFERLAPPHRPRPKARLRSKSLGYYG